MKISNKFLLIAIASVVSTSVIPSSFGLGRGAGWQNRVETGTWWGSNPATEPTFESILALGEKQKTVGATLESILSSEKATTHGVQNKLETKVKQSKDFEKSKDFNQLDGKTVSTHRKLRNSLETSLNHTKAHKAKIERLHQRLETLKNDSDKTIKSRKNQMEEDMKDMVDKKAAKDKAMASSHSKPSVVYPYGTVGGTGSM